MPGYIHGWDYEAPLQFWPEREEGCLGEEPSLTLRPTLILKKRWLFSGNILHACCELCFHVIVFFFFFFSLKEQNQRQLKKLNKHIKKVCFPVWKPLELTLQSEMLHKLQKIMDNNCFPAENTLLKQHRIFCQRLCQFFCRKDSLTVFFPSAV